MTKDLDCDFEVIEFELQLHYYVPFQTNSFMKGMNPLSLAMG